MVERDHVGAVAFRHRGVLMGFHKEAIGTGSNCRLGDGGDELWFAAGDTGGAVGLLEGVCDIDDNGALTHLLHNGHATHIDHEVAISEESSTLGNSDMRIARLCHLIAGESHRLGSEELPLLDVDHLAGAGSRDQQVGLATKECRYLEHIDIIGSHLRLFGAMDVGYDRDMERVTDLTEHFEGLAVADTGKRIEAATIGLAIRTLEYIRDIEIGSNLDHTLGDVESHLFSLDDAGTGEEEEIVRLT